MKKILFILLACLTLACNDCLAQTKHKSYTTQDIYGSWVIIGMWDNGKYLSTLGATDNAMGIMFRGNACYVTAGDTRSYHDIKIANGNVVRAYKEGSNKPTFTLKLLSVKRGQEIVGILDFLEGGYAPKVKLASVFMTE